MLDRNKTQKRQSLIFYARGNQALLSGYKFQPIKDRRDGATIYVKVDFCCSVEFIVILLNAMRFSSHLNV